MKSDQDFTGSFGSLLDDMWASFTMPSPFDTILENTTNVDQQILQSSPDSTGQETSNHRDSEALFTNLNPPQSLFSAGHSSHYVPDSTFAVNDYQPPVNRSPPCAEITDIEGRWLFKVRHPREDNDKAPAKGISWTYSRALEELYVKMDVDCPFLIQTEGTPPSGSIIRATPHYRRAEDKNDVPQRCLHHSAVEHETNRGRDNIDHIIRSEHAFYERDAAGRMSTVVPFAVPEINCSIYLYRFMCRTSCVGGMNRRPICIVFTLELNGQILGRQVRLVKVSACPGRDCKKNEERSGKNVHTPSFARSTAQSSEANPASEGVKKAVKRISSSLQDLNRTTNNGKRQKVYNIAVTNKRFYNILSAMLQILQRNLSNPDCSSCEEDDTYSPVAVVPEIILGSLMGLVPENESDFKKEPEETKESDCVVPTTGDGHSSSTVDQQWITLYSKIDEIVERATRAITEGRPFPNTDKPSQTVKVKIEKDSPDSNEGCGVDCSTSTSTRTSDADRGFSIKSWLSSLHLSGYLGQFLSRGYFYGSQLRDITMMDLSEMGIAEDDCNILWKSLISWWCRNSQKDT